MVGEVFDRKERRRRGRRSLAAIACFVLPGSGKAQSSLTTHPDVRYYLNVTGGVNPGGMSWADSYSVGDECYCDISSFDHGIGPVAVNTRFGWKTVEDVCALLGPGPGPEGHPVYNDVQCGNGPPNDAGDEHVCPGRTDIGPDGCGQIGPKWKFRKDEDIPMTPATPPEDAHEDIVAVVPIPGTINPGGASWGDSYSVGNQCYCDSTFDHNIGPVWIQTLIGWVTVRQVCDLLGPGPKTPGRPVYNDVQCGNGPPNDASDEQPCPGRVDIGAPGCGQIGPTWNFGKKWKTGANRAGAAITAPYMTSTSGNADGINKRWFIMYSANKVRKRFPNDKPSSGMSKKFIAVYYDTSVSRWKFDRAIARLNAQGTRVAVPIKEQSHVVFNPTPGDRLMAELIPPSSDANSKWSLTVFDQINHASTAQNLPFLATNKINGISAGYLGGDLQFAIASSKEFPGLFVVNISGKKYYELETY